MKVFVTGVGGQLGHDVMNELHKRGYEGIGSDIAPQYSGVADGTAVTTMPYVKLDITDAAAVRAVLEEVKPDVVIHCAAWTAVDLAEDGIRSKRSVPSMPGAQSTLPMSVKRWTARWSISARTMSSTDRVKSPGSRTARTMRL